MTDLYQIYRTTSQRYKRTPCDNFKEMAALAKHMVFGELDRYEIIDIGNAILKIEQLEQLSNIRVSQGKKIINAVKNNNYEINIPYVMRHRMRSETGTIYIFTSNDLPNQVKIGATALPIVKRVRLYRKRYNTQVDIYFSKRVSDVFDLERRVHEKLQDVRVNQNNPGGSIEWFYMSPLKAKELILSNVQ